ncbi:MAG: RNA polymerase sigma factor SigF [Sciscionella sp.]|nr:RNA polymerase sigma factor SigF [Sciscionella sp.]
MARDGEYDHLMPCFLQLAELAEDDPRRARLREKLVAAHLPLARNIAHRFSGRGESQEDLTQVALLGLVNAVDRFEPARGNDFLSFAVPTIMGEIRRYFRDTSWAMRVPRRLKELHLALGNARGQLSQRIGRAPTARELAEHLGLSLDEVYEGLEAGNAYHTTSLSEPAPDAGDDIVRADSIGEEDESFDFVEYRESVQPLIERLPERNRQILYLRFFRDMTQTQIAERIGVSQMHVSRLLAQTMQTLRDKLSSAD